MPRQRNLEHGDAPRARELFSGKEAPFSRALAWCGWQVDYEDMVLDPSHDVSIPATQQRLTDSAGTFDLHFLGTCCKSLTRAREKAKNRTGYID